MAINRTEFRKMHVSSSAEKMIADYQTGMIDISRYDRAVQIRRINMFYESPHVINIKVFADGDLSSVIGSLNFPANSSGSKIVSLRPQFSARAKSLCLKISSLDVATLSTIRKIEVEIDE
tara:strand:+ start:2377 stop:2736 length:360 start_codon:yes stop_codon:yes gene_type:complete